MVIMEHPRPLAQLLLNFRQKHVHKPSRLGTIGKKAKSALDKVAEVGGDLVDTMAEVGVDVLLNDSD